MSWPRAFRGSRVDQIASVAATGKLLDIPSAASANTKGSWVQLTASAPFASAGFFVGFGNGDASTDLLVDIGVGAAGSEQVVVSNILVSIGSGFASSATDVFFPLAVAEGQRLAARCQASAANGDIDMGLQLCAGDFFSQLGLGRATTYGANTADSGGVSVDPGAVANTKGAWSEISASITNPIRYMLICIGGQANAVMTSSFNLLDIGMGAAGSEQVVVDDLYLVAADNVDYYLPGMIGRPVSVASGQRLAARKQCSTTDATDRLNDIVIIGFD